MEVHEFISETKDPVLRGILKNLRTKTINGETWYSGKDVASNLDYKRSAKAVADHVAPEDRVTDYFSTDGGQQPMVFINRKGLESLCAKARTTVGNRLRKALSPSKVKQDGRRRPVFGVLTGKGDRGRVMTSELGN